MGKRGAWKGFDRASCVRVVGYIFTKVYCQNRQLTVQIKQVLNCCKTQYFSLIQVFQKFILKEVVHSLVGCKETAPPGCISGRRIWDIRWPQTKSPRPSVTSSHWVNTNPFKRGIMGHTRIHNKKNAPHPHPLIKHTTPCIELLVQICAQLNCNNWWSSLTANLSSW